jgi:small subunit ribosomal protein S8e
VKRKMKERLRARKIDQHLAEQFQTGRLFACIASRPGQCGRCDGYILEGKELEFYLRKMQKKKSKAA